MLVSNGIRKEAESSKLYEPTIPISSRYIWKILGGSL